MSYRSKVLITALNVVNIFAVLELFYSININHIIICTTYITFSLNSIKKLDFRAVFTLLSSHPFFLYLTSWSLQKENAQVFNVLLACGVIFPKVWLYHCYLCWLPPSPHSPSIVFLTQGPKSPSHNAQVVHELRHWSTAKIKYALSTILLNNMQNIVDSYIELLLN